MLYEFEFPSANKRDQIQAWFTVPADEIKGVIQVIHGFAEHSRRYLHMISAFADAGFIVAYDDHVGHGKTAVVNDSWGDWGDEVSSEIMVQDEISLMEEAKKTFKDLGPLPYFIFGHSMGSVIARQMSARVGDDLAGATYCGTCGDFPTEEAKALLEDLVNKQGRGDQADPKAQEAVLGSFNDRVGEVKIGNEWICHDPHVQIDHAKDPLNATTKPVHNRSLLDFVYMIDEVKTRDWAEKVPKDLPIYLIGGDQDPFGNYGQGVYYTANLLIDTGHDVMTRVYPGLRHEVHNYPAFKDEVETRIIYFFMSQLDLDEDEGLL